MINYIVFENEIPSLFVFCNHKTKKSQPEPIITIPTDLAAILKTYIDCNTVVKHDFYLERNEVILKSIMHNQNLLKNHKICFNKQVKE